MSWKPSRSSGIMLDRAMSKSDKYRNELANILPIYNPPPFDKINYISKCFYLYYLNENKAHELLLCGSALKRDFSAFCPNYYTNIFKRYPKLVYKPLLKILNN